MKKYISEYMSELKKFLDNELSKADQETKDKVLHELETKILYFQH